MRFLKSLFFITVLAIGLVSFCRVAGFAEQSKSFENSQLKYALKYPSDFQVKNLGMAVVFIFPDNDKKTGFQPDLNVAVKTLTPPVPELGEFFAKGKEKLTLGGNQVEIIEEKKDKLGGNEARRIIFTTKIKKTNFKLLQVVSIYKNNVYVVTYTALPEQFDRNLSKANSIIKSLKFKD